MIIDELNEFCDAASVAAVAGTANLGDVIDLRSGFNPNTLQDIGGGQPVYLVISVDTSIITGGAAGTIQFRLVSDAVNPPDTSTATVHWTSKAFVTDDDALNELDAGDVIVVPLPIEKLYEEFLGVQRIIATTTTTAGAVSAYLTLNPPSRPVHADNVA